MNLTLRKGLFRAAIFFLAAPVAEAGLKSQRLSNGMELISYESHKVPLVTIVLTVKAGSFTEQPDTNGLTHLWEHMFFKGNAAIPNQEAFRKRIQDLGIVYNGDTNTELVRYYFTLPSAFLDEGLNFMFQAIATPLIDQQELERERKVVLDEWDRNASQPSFELYRLRLKAMYGSGAYLRNPLGERSIVEKAQREQLMLIKNEVFVPENSALLIAGDFDSDKIENLVNKAFQAWKNPENWKPLTISKLSEFPKISTELVKIHPQTRNIGISLTHEGPLARSNPGDAAIADVLSGLVNHSLGEFHKRFIDSGLSYSAGFGYLTQSQAGELTLWASCGQERYRELREVLLQEEARWVEPGYFTEQQLDDVRRSLVIERKFSENKPSAYIKDIAFWWAITGLDFYEKYIETLNKVSLSDVRSFAKSYLLAKPSVTSVLLSDEDAKKLGVKDQNGSVEIERGQP
ncbi:MAG: pitrilysin family protein [Proteobacteria bacterium]|nr:pitrilysin family protein [Pseudomonadota bacterium]